MIKINKAGYLYIVLTILIGFSAVNTGNNLVYIVTSALLSYMLVSGIFGRQNIYRADIELDFPEEVYAGIDCPVGVKLVNKRRFIPSFLVRVSIGEEGFFFPFVNAGAFGYGHINLVFDRRGRHGIEALSISSTFPFNFFTRFRRVVTDASLIVYPKPVKCDILRPDDLRTRSKGDRSSNRVGYDEDILSIRDYVPGDRLKYISWKSTAKTGRLKTKELSSVETERVTIDFDRMEKKNTEFAVSCVTFTILKLLRSNVPVGLVIGGETHRPNVSPSHKSTLLTKLALYGSED